ncbi:hypothetical protein MBUL_01220 [Methylobacterium bullatum]|uniref:Uncharacterized protein n=1 Tax=Methylobacterium bullatum TaxID=570505 RepID=A0A679INN5_9HYPH|nr:hypothetical protein MBUL_01220 [Methylobacterium bullatum]
MAGAVAARQEHRPLVSVGWRTAPVLFLKLILPEKTVVTPSWRGGFLAFCLCFDGLPG